MATEQGMVINIHGNIAVVKTKRSEACKGCSEHGSCSTQGNDMEVEVFNRMGAAIGDEVAIQIQTGSFMKATFLLYVFPILCMITGAVAGEKLAPSIAFDKSALSAILGFLGLFIGLWVVKIKGREMGRKEEYHPKIIRIIRKHVVAGT
jgi:sigma-E factor negative regulatory protein RseC